MNTIQEFTDQSVIQECTVQTTREVCGKFILYHCSHKHLNMLEMGVDTIMRRTPKHLEPSSSVPTYFGSMGWTSTVSFLAE